MIISTINQQGLQMIHCSFPPPIPSPTATILNLKSTKTLRDLHQLHARAIKTGHIHDPLVAAEVLRASALSADRDLLYARNVFDQMPEPNCFSWNTIIRSFAESEDSPSNAITLFYQMLLHEAVQPNQFTFPSVLKACARVEAIREGEQVHAYAAKFGFGDDQFVITNLVRMYVLCGRTEDARRLLGNGSISPMDEANVVLYNTMIDGYFRLGMIDHARELFDEMPKRSLVSWNGMISGYARIGCFKEAVGVFQKMQLEGVRPNYVTLVSVLPAVSRIGDFELGKYIHRYAEKSGIKVDDVLGSALVDMYSKCGHIDKAIEVFERLPKSNSITWSALIGGLALHGRARDALDHFHMMEAAGVIPNDVVFIGILNACSHAGLLEQGRSYFDRMESVYGLRPRIEHYGCMVDMLSRAGLLKEAEELVNNMPMEADDVIYKALLSACKIHGNVEIGASAANRLLELAPDDGGCNVLLSNYYASIGDWEAVAKVRLRMKDLDIRKDPGFSLITIDGLTHEFVVEDKSHPRTEEIYSMLEQMRSKLSAAGYVPETSEVLLNLDEEEKESTLIYHSEKIAIAFGLISTRRTTALHVVKNLRVCGDCHSSIKLISKIYGRSIVVRDRNRFHHFEAGTCSCNDYW